MGPVILAFVLTHGLQNLPPRTPLWCQLAAPVVVYFEVPWVPNDPRLAQAIYAYCIRAEIVGKGEADWLTRDLLSNLYWVRHYAHDLWDAPPLADCQRFPDEAYLVQRIGMNRHYAAFLNGNLDYRVDPSSDDWTRAALTEANGIYEQLDHLRSAQNSSFVLCYRRSQLKLYRESIGWSAYYAGYVPAPIPLHFCQEIR